MNKARHDKMVSLVASRRMLALQKSLASAHNPQEADRLMREAGTSIDGLACELSPLNGGIYGSTEDDIKIVESVK